jgi:transcriptional regulator with XRE-family HTH domain
MDKPSTATGELIRKLRRQRNWTAQRLAEECVRSGAPWLTRGTIAKIESGVRKSITSEELVALAQAFGVTLAHLAGTPSSGSAITHPERADPGKGQGVILVSVGSPSIRGNVVRSLPDLSLETAEFVGEYVFDEYVAPEKLHLIALALRDGARLWADDPRFSHLHLFYRGPVVFGPLLGVVIAPARPMSVYHHDGGRYQRAYTIDHRFLRSRIGAG